MAAASQMMASAPTFCNIASPSFCRSLDKSVEFGSSFEFIGRIAPRKCSARQSVRPSPSSSRREFGRVFCKFPSQLRPFSSDPMVSNHSCSSFHHSKAAVSRTSQRRLVRSQAQDQKAEGQSKVASAPALAYVVVYVNDVEKSVAFYEKAFGLKTRMTQGNVRTAWAEMETGSTTLAFTPQDQRETVLSGGVKAHKASEAAPNVLVSLTYDDVHSAYKHAVENGAKGMAEPEDKPWGMTAGYVKDIDGILVQIGSHVKGQ